MSRPKIVHIQVRMEADFSYVSAIPYFCILSFEVGQGEEGGGISSQIRGKLSMGWLLGSVARTITDDGSNRVYV